MSGRQLEDEDAEHLIGLKRQIAADLYINGVDAYPYKMENDVYVEGALTDIVKVYLEWRSEIDEELG